MVIEWYSFCCSFLLGSKVKKKILIVDDNTDLNRVLQMSLTESYETISAMNGEDAVDLAVTEVPDLIIMDLMLNGMNGFEAISLIRQVPKTMSIPIIAITAGLSNTVEEECARIGVNPIGWTVTGLKLECPPGWLN